jgi:hypothetical protein
VGPPSLFSFLLSFVLFRPYRGLIPMPHFHPPPQPQPDCGRLVGYVTSMDLLVHDNSSPLLSIVRACEVVVKESDEYDDAILAMREKRLTYAPVVDGNDIVVRG